MNIDIINKLDEITNIIENDKDIKLMKKIEKELLNDKELLDKIKQLKEINDYNPQYIALKKEILDNKKYKEYKKLETEMFLIIKEINSKLNSFKEKSCCI